MNGIEIIRNYCQVENESTTIILKIIPDKFEYFQVLSN